jgi:hypothetical protein
MRKITCLSLLLLLGLSFCFTRCKDNNPHIDPPPPPPEVSLNGKWDCRDTTIWIGGYPEYNYRVLTFDETTFEYIIEIGKKDSHDHSITQVSHPSFNLISAVFFLWEVDCIKALTRV